jgi:DNA-binding transcriptional ArsR family regulator
VEDEAHAEHEAQAGREAHAEDRAPRDATDAEARALASGLRLGILRMCLDQPLTNREIAATLGKNPATVLHHVRTLVDTGYLEALEPRRGRRGAREIPYRSTGKSWFTRMPATASGSLLSAFLDEVSRVPPEEHELTRLGLRLGESDLAEFRDRLHALLQEFHDRPRDPRAVPRSLFVALHLDPFGGPAPDDPPGSSPSPSPSSSAADDASDAGPAS